MTKHADNANVIAPPPLIYALPLLIGAGLHALWSWHLIPSSLDAPRQIISVIILLISPIAGVWGIIELFRAKTSPLPERPTTAIVTSGPFAFTRNPIYLTFTLFYLGVALYFNNGWSLLLLIPTLYIVHKGVIMREERYLEAKFGDEYRHYRARVRRWI